MSNQLSMSDAGIESNYSPARSPSLPTTDTTMFVDSEAAKNGKFILLCLSPPSTLSKVYPLCNLCLSSTKEDHSASSSYLEGLSCMSFMSCSLILCLYSVPSLV